MADTTRKTFKVFSESCPYRAGHYGALCNYFGEGAFSCTLDNCPIYEGICKGCPRIVCRDGHTHWGMPVHLISENELCGQVYVPAGKDCQLCVFSK